jgi:hypothetical protein
MCTPAAERSPHPTRGRQQQLSRFDRNSHTGRNLATETADHYRPVITASFTTLRMPQA